MSPNTFVNFFGLRVEKNTHFFYVAYGYYALTVPAGNLHANWCQISTIYQEMGQLQLFQYQYRS
jgi:hypothetical protein